MCELCAALSAGGSVDGDALGGDMSAFAALRVFLPPLFPSIRLGNAGIRTQLFTCVGTLTPKPTASSFLIDCTFRKAIVIAGSCVNRCNGFVGANSLVVWRSCGPYPDLVPCFRSFYHFSPMSLQVIPLMSTLSLQIQGVLGRRKHTRDVDGSLMALVSLW
jgi:hypothetical protein